MAMFGIMAIMLHPKTKSGHQPAEPARRPLGHLRCAEPGKTATAHTHEVLGTGEREQPEPANIGSEKRIKSHCRDPLIHRAP